MKLAACDMLVIRAALVALVWVAVLRLLVATLVQPFGAAGGFVLPGVPACMAEWGCDHRAFGCESGPGFVCARASTQTKAGIAAPLTPSHHKRSPSPFARLLAPH